MTASTGSLDLLLLVKFGHLEEKIRKQGGWVGSVVSSFFSKVIIVDCITRLRSQIMSDDFDIQLVCRVFAPTTSMNLPITCRIS